MLVVSALSSCKTRSYQELMQTSRLSGNEQGLQMISATMLSKVRLSQHLASREHSFGQCEPYRKSCTTSSPPPMFSQVTVI